MIKEKILFFIRKNLIYDVSASRIKSAKKSSSFIVIYLSHLKALILIN